MKIKTCSKCKKRKELSDFSKDKHSKDGYKAQCKECWKKYYLENKEYIDKKHAEWKEKNEEKIRDWYLNNKENRKKYSAEYFQTHKEELYKKQREWNKNNLDKIKFYAKRSYEKNKIKINKQRKDYRERNKERIQARRREYYLEHKEEIVEYHRQHRLKNLTKERLRSKEYYEKNKKIINSKKVKKLQNNIDLRIAFNLRARISKLFNYKQQEKCLSSMFLIGCDIDYLMYHLQSQFKEGMSWDNYGKGDNGKGMQEWHIDHIKPCASFDLSKPEEQRKCFHYTNLRPLWATENLSKGDKHL